MIVYGSTLSPFVRKVLVVAAEKGLEVENRPVRPGAPPPEGFEEASPFAKVPALREGAFTLADSTAIAVYLDAKHPAPRLIPEEPEARGRVMWFDEFSDTISQPAKVKIFFNRVVAPLTGRPADEAAAQKVEAEELPRIHAYLERTVPDVGGFLVGDRLSLADISVASPFVNLRHAGSRVDAAAHPRLAAWVEGVLARPAFADLIARDDAFLERARTR